MFSGASSGEPVYETFIILDSVFPPSPERQTYFPLLCTSQAAVLSIIIRDIKKMDDMAVLNPTVQKRGLNVHNTQCFIEPQVAGTGPVSISIHTSPSLARSSEPANFGDQNKT